MTLSNARKAKLRWEVIDGAFQRWEYYDEQYEELTSEENAYLKQAIRRAARALNVKNHIYLP